MRARRDRTQEVVADRAGMHRNYVGAIERGEKNPTFARLVALASALDMTLGELFALYEARRDDPVR
jgi:transcriptional regulator with XRE-family HTH domain